MGGKKYNSMWNREEFKNKDYIYSWYKLLSSFYFIFSPPGSGWDCYRTWEAIYLGTVPILLKTDTPFDNMYDDLPVIFVNNYEMVTEKYLLNEWEKMSKKTFNFDKIKVKYWSNLIENKLR